MAIQVNISKIGHTKFLAVAKVKGWEFSTTDNSIEEIKDRMFEYMNEKADDLNWPPFFESDLEFITND